MTPEETRYVKEFARKIAQTMDTLRSSSVFFIIQQAYGPMDWPEAQALLDTIIRHTEAKP